MKILFICNEYPPVHHGGIGSFTKLIAEKMVLAGHEVHVTGYAPGIKSNQEEMINGVKIIRLKNDNFNKAVILNYANMVISRIKFFKTVNKYVGLFKPDIIETYDWSAPLIFRPDKGKLLTRLHGSNTANNLYVGMKTTPVLSLLEKRAIKQADYIISVSDHIADITQKAFKIKFSFKTIYNGVNTKVFTNQRHKRDLNKIVLVGRMHPYKGFDELFKAMNLIFRQHQTVYFQIICSVVEDYKTRLMNLVDQKYHERIQFTGRIPNESLPAYYNTANLSVLPSRTEAFPIIPLESMACGTPVIMADRFSSHEIIDNEVDGFLVNTFDTENFAKRIVEILSDQQTIENMRLKARKKIETHFSTDKIINDNIQFYESIALDKINV